MDSFAGLIFLLLIGKWFQQSTWAQLSFERDYKSYFPVAATIRQGEEETTVPVERLVWNLLYCQSWFLLLVSMVHTISLVYTVWQLLLLV